MLTKICTKCKEEKDINDFYKNHRIKCGLCSHCKKCQKEYTDNYHKKYPWKRTLSDMKSRCENPNNISYKNYGKRGIECKITEDEIKFLWFRDKAYEMFKPSMHRKNSNKNYTLENCQYVELGNNVCFAHGIPILQYDLDGNFIREFKSIRSASKFLKIGHLIIINCLNSKYIWRYK